MNWLFSPVAETLAELIGVTVHKGCETAMGEANALLDDEGGMCNADCIIGVARALTRRRRNRGRGTFTHAEWARIVATRPEERFVDCHLVMPLDRDDKRWVYESSFWIAVHTRHLACYWALGLDGPEDLWQVVYGHTIKHHACSIIWERSCPCYAAKRCSFELYDKPLVV